MKFDTEKFFGYPVLILVDDEDNTVENKDFGDEKSTAKLELKWCVEKPNTPILEYEFKLSVKEIVKQIKVGNLKTVIDIRCKKTFYSELFCVDLKKQQSGKLEIDLHNLRDIVEIHAYIIAVTDFEFSSESIDEEYGYKKFKLPKGNIIAWKRPKRYFIEKDQYRSIRSIIDFQADSEKNPGEYEVNAEHDYVIVYAHSDFIEKCRHAEKSDAKYGILASLYVPIVAELFLKMIKGDEVGELKWAKILQSKATEKELNWEKEENIFNNAQKILNNPLQIFSEKGFSNHEDTSDF